MKLTRTPSFGDLYWSKKAGLGINFDETVTSLLRLRKSSGTFDTLTADDVEECFMVVEYSVK